MSGTVNILHAAGGQPMYAPALPVGPDRPSVERALADLGVGPAVACMLAAELEAAGGDHAAGACGRDVVAELGCMPFIGGHRVQPAEVETLLVVLARRGGAYLAVVADSRLARADEAAAEAIAIGMPRGLLLRLPAALASRSDQAKARETLRARCALKGIVLQVSADDRGRPEYIVTQGAWTRAFSTTAELEGWVDRVEGKAT